MVLIFFLLIHIKEPTAERGKIMDLYEYEIRISFFFDGHVIKVLHL